MKSFPLLIALLLLLTSCGQAGPSDDGKLYANYGIITHNWTWMYLRDGKAYWAGGLTPAGGLEAFDFAAFAAKNPNNVADYQFTSDKLILTHKDGKKEEQKMTRDNSGGMLLDGAPWAQVLPLGDGAPLAGSFDWSLSFHGGGVASTTTFDKTGKFKQRIVTGVSSNDGKYGKEGDSTNDGTYSVKGYTLTMQHADGKSERHTAGTIDKEVSALYVDDTVLNRKK